MKKLFRKKEKEEGQALLEFVLVIPIFLFCLCLIVDYGWLFYHYISVENSARNAARIACVEYDNVCVDKNLAGEKISTGTTTYYLNDAQLWDEYNDEERSVLNEVKNTVTSPEKVESVIITYTADETAPEPFKTSVRADGDVKITVNYNLRMLVGLTGGGMNKTIKSESTFKVEKNATS